MVDGDPFYLKFWSTGPRWSEIADFELIFTRSAAALTPSKKLSLSPPKGGSKTQSVQN